MRPINYKTRKWKRYEIVKLNGQVRNNNAIIKSVLYVEIERD